jgi:hypothetical protein
MSAKHTPGPWRVALPPNDRIQSRIIYSAAGSVARAYNNTKAAQANARLIAAAPELLAALQEARELVRLLASRYSHGPAEVAVDRIDAAIAKAVQS